MSSILEESRQSSSLGKFKITKKKIIILISIILILVSIFYFFNKEDTKNTTISQKEWTVKKDNLKISIESDGRVVAEDGVDLFFSVSGNNLEVEKVFIKEGDKIKKGDKIATVKTESLELNVRTAYSSYLSALADYNQTMDGATDEQIADAQGDITATGIFLKQAKIDLKENQEDLNDIEDEFNNEDINDAYENLIDTIKATNISLNNILRESDEIVGVDNQYLNNAFENNLGAKDSSS
ncbi:biotin/lipoyl-binding protein, partial [bacterium]|nr:biotin/lipoyl-binding protein [bacterium]